MERGRPYVCACRCVCAYVRADIHIASHMSHVGILIFENAFKVHLVMQCACCTMGKGENSGGNSAVSCRGGALEVLCLGSAASSSDSQGH